MHRVAHRGYSAVAPENTLPALVAAVRAGATHVEFDVRTSADDVPVVIHDRTLDRTTDGTGHVWDHSLDAIRALDAGSWFSPAFAGVKVPLLSEVLSLPWGDVTLLVEIKPPASPDQVKRIVTMVDNRAIVQSFDHEIVRNVGEFAPRSRRGLLRPLLDSDTVELASSLGVECCNIPVGEVTPERVAEFAARGIEVMAWTANDLGSWPAMAAAGVAGLITDHTGELTGWASSR
ncbi:glycerophosphodiester phosphodiesterase [Actinoplanes sp. NPDC049265]|uniref:glycerophosphodiester phosphodiesterase n=1 Tax=Actinoplanes sp. NPDC049265 TaxID=3363902 RepID=UPI0037146C8B